MALHLIEVPALRIDSGYAGVSFKNEVKLGAAFQIEFWFRPDQIARPGFVPVLDMQFAIASHTVYVWFGLLDGEAAFGVYPDGGYAGQSFPLEQKKWCHVSALYSNSGSKLDVTFTPLGASAQRRTFTGLSPRRFGGPVKNIQIGGMFTTHLAQQGAVTYGAYADLRLWSQPPSPQDTALRQPWRLAGNEPGLAGYWMMDEGEGTILHDSSAYRNDGERVVRAYAWEPSSGLELAIGSVVPGASDYVATRQITYCDARRAALETELGTLSNRKSGLERDGGTLEQRDQQAQQALEAQVRDNEEKIKQKQAALDARRREIAGIEEEEQKKKQASNSIRLRDFIVHVQEDMDESRRRIRSQYGRVYGLDKMSLDIKMIPGFGGVGLRLPDPQQKTEAARLSTLTLDFRARAIEEEPTPVNAWVPQLEGTTEIFARRKLTEAGFRVEVAYQVVTELSGQHGRVLRQVYNEIESGKAVLGSLIGLLVGRAR